jgi:deoxycytidine triphosphate deaminase
MILGIDELIKLVKERGLVKNLSERELKNPEGTGFDIRIGEIYRLKDEGFLGIEERRTPDVELIAKYGKDKGYVLKPNEFVLIKTMEKLNVPENLAVLIFPRSTLYRCGVQFLCTKTDPGYFGKLVFGLKNLANKNFKIELGSRIANIVFLEIKGKTVPYRGQWKGGRVTAKKKEKQI